MIKRSRRGGLNRRSPSRGCRRRRSGGGGRGGGGGDGIRGRRSRNRAGGLGSVLRVEVELGEGCGGTLLSWRGRSGLRLLGVEWRLRICVWRVLRMAHSLASRERVQRSSCSPLVVWISYRRIRVKLQRTRLIEFSRREHPTE